MSSDNVFIFLIRDIRFRCLLKSIEFLSYSCGIFIAYISIGNWEPVVTCGFDCFTLFFCKDWSEIILWSEDTPLKVVYDSQSTALFIPFLLMSILSCRFPSGVFFLGGGVFRHKRLFLREKSVRYSPFLLSRLCKQNLLFSSLPM